MNAWIEWKPFTDPNYDIVWDEFVERFGFLASTSPEYWPGINEPSPSVTFSIGHVYHDTERSTDLLCDINTKALRAFQDCVHPEQRLAVLDWRHPCYWLYPHRAFDSSNPHEWPIPVLPNGDYYIFLAEDLSFGMFGHPWEQTICVFGASLLKAIMDDPPALFDRPFRKDGKLIEGARDYTGEAKREWMRPAVWDEMNRRWTWADSTT